MTPAVSPRTFRRTPVVLLAIFATAGGTAAVILTSQAASLALILLFLVSALGLSAAWRLRAVQLELRRLELRTAALETIRHDRTEPVANADFEAAAPPGAPTEAPTLAAGSNGHPEPQLRILLAEDNPVNQEVALLMLDRLGHRADVASNGLEVLDALMRQSYDVVLMDVQMPAMDGFEVTRKLRRHFRGRRRPRIIALTAHADRQQCLAAGMDDYLAKPLHKEALATALGAVIDPLSGFSLSELSATESIDEQRLEQLRKLPTKAPQSLFAQIVDVFFESSAKDLGRLRSAVIQGDGLAFRDAAHSLLGSSSDLGLTSVSGVCLELKRIPDDCPREQLEETVGRLERHLGRARTALERMRALS